MNIIDALFSATVGGGLIGSGVHLLTDYLDRKNKIAMLEAQTKSTEAVEAWKAFTAAQQGTSVPFAVPTNAAPWASTLYTLVAALKDVTRPLLTFCAVGIVLTVYLKSTPVAREQATPEILAASFGAIYFWFGSRYTRK